MGFRCSIPGLLALEPCKFSGPLTCCPSSRLRFEVSGPTPLREMNCHPWYARASRAPFKFWFCHPHDPTRGWDFRNPLTCSYPCEVFVKVQRRLRNRLWIQSVPARFLFSDLFSDPVIPCRLSSWLPIISYWIHVSFWEPGVAKHLLLLSLSFGRVWGFPESFLAMKVYRPLFRLSHALLWLWFWST